MRFLVIQTAFLGDVILASSLLEKLHLLYPHAQIDFLLKKGNESLFEKHPYIHKVLVLDKSRKWTSFFSILRYVRQQHYTRVINLHRFFSSGLLTVLSGAQATIGFNKNPLSFLFTYRLPHHIAPPYEAPLHEIVRNDSLIDPSHQNALAHPKLYPSASHFEKIKPLIQRKFITISPTSIWFTKQFPQHKWVHFINQLPPSLPVYLLGASSDMLKCHYIELLSSHPNMVNLAGKLSLLESAALISQASMNYANDSASLHLASSMNAPSTAIFCSTVPAFGFGPLSSRQYIVETPQKLSCRPCGLHGKKACPLGHFNCAEGIPSQALLQALKK